MPACDVRHQPRAHRILQRAMSSRRLPHAYIFHGPDGVGKQMLAVRFAQLLLCPNPTTPELTPELPPELADQTDIAWRDACDNCEDCKLTRAETHPDMQVIYKELNRYHPAPEVRGRKAIDLSVDVIRHYLIERVKDRPARGLARVFVVSGAEQMSVAAQNSLLKTLEEPPESAFIILVTRSLDRLLQTTLSRCQPVPFSALPADFVAEQLRERLPDLPEEQARFLAGYCGGRLGVALHLAGADLLEIKTRLNQALANLRGVGPTGLAKHIQDDASGLADGYIAEMVEAGMIDRASEASTTEPTRRGLMDLLSMASCLYRDVLRSGCGASEQLTNIDQIELVDQMADRISPEAAAQAIRDIRQAETDIAANANVPLALEALAIRLLRHEAGGSENRAQAARGRG